MRQVSVIKVLYFASIRERLNCTEEAIESSNKSQTISHLKNLLSSRGGEWNNVFSNNSQLLSAVNQVASKDDQIVNDGDEVGFFPQVTGG